MRDFLDSILEFLSFESLTDLEWESDEVQVIAEDDEEYTKEIFEALKAVLESREEVSDQIARLSYYFKSKGTEVDGSIEPKSQIYIGSVL